MTTNAGNRLPRLTQLTSNELSDGRKHIEQDFCRSGNQYWWERFIVISRCARTLLLALLLANGLHASDPDDNNPDNTLTETLAAESTEESSVASEATMVEATSARLIPLEWLEAKPLKEIPFGDSGWLEFGGSYRARHHRETNMRPGTTGGLSGLDDSFWLQCF